MPTTTTGKATELITFSRTSNATVTDSDGKIKWAPHNLLLASEQFDASSWSKASNGALPSVSANIAVAPNGATMADQIAFNAVAAGGDYTLVYRTVGVASGTYTLGVWVKAATSGDVGKKIWLYSYLSSISGLTSATLTTEWQLLSTTVTVSSGNLEYTFGVTGSNNGGSNQAAVTASFWGAHLYRSDLGGMQANTSAYPMYNPTTPKNLLGYTEDFTNAYWGKSNAPVTADVGIAPNGLNTADRITFSAQYGQVFKTGVVTLSGSVGTISVWLKLESGNANLALRGSNSGTTYLQNITVTSSWQRFSATFTHDGTNNIGFVLEDRNASGFGSVLIWGAQLSDSASLDAYVPNYGAAPTAAAYYGPRLDYDPVTLAAKGLLVEESRANLVLNSAAFGSWSDNGATVTANTVVAPDGTTTADELTRASATSDSRFQTVTFTGDGTKSVSIYVKYNTAPTFAVFLYDSTAVANRMLIDFAFTAGVPASSTINSGSVEAIENVGGGWYRIKMLCPSVVAANTNVLYVYPARTGSANGQKTTFWGAQAENGSFATSYIPTGAATATRNPDVASVSTSQFPYSQSAGSFVVAFDSVRLNSGMLGDQSGTTAIAYANSNDFKTFNGSATVSSANNWTINATTKGAVAYDGSGRAVCLNSGTVASDANTFQTVSTVELGRAFLSVYLNGHIRQITYIPRRLSNTELQTRTA